MPTVKWSPLRQVALLQERLDQAMDDVLFDFAGTEAGSSNGWVPPVDIYETANKIVLKAEMPGVDRDNVKVEITDNILTLRGEKRVEREVEEANYHRLERVFGTFERRFSLPKSVDQENIRANYKHGVLEVSLPKAEKSHSIQIKVRID